MSAAAGSNCNRASQPHDGVKKRRRKQYRVVFDGDVPEEGSRALLVDELEVLRDFEQGRVCDDGDLDDVLGKETPLS